MLYLLYKLTVLGLSYRAFNYIKSIFQVQYINDSNWTDGDPVGDLGSIKKNGRGEQ